MVHGSELPVYRLPHDVVPRHYDLNIITFLEPDNFNFQGNVKIKVECLQATDTIKVHVRDLTISADKVKVMTDDDKSLAVASTHSDTENEFYVVKVREALAAGKVYSLQLMFQGQLKENLIGYYRCSYVDHATNSTKWLAVTHFEPSDARQAFPCFDEPGMRATFTIRLAHKDLYKAVSNMPLNNTTPFEGKSGWVWSEFQTTVPMSTYIVAYMVSEFSYVQAEPVPSANNVLFRVWARPDAIDQVDFAATVGPRFLAYYEHFFDIKYPLPKQDLLAIPDFKIGAMENWGIITFKELLLLVDKKLASSTEKLHSANVIAHEIAHMWFGNLVTIPWWTDVWLKEGFATYMASLSVHKEFPEWNSLDVLAISDLLNVFILDSLKSSHPVSVPIGHPREISQIFDVISYDKGSFLLRMIDLFLGNEVFRAGVSEYLKKHQFRNAEQDDLWAELTEQAHKHNALPAEVTVKDIMDSWTLQTGYPLITVTRHYSTGKATVSQRRFLTVKSDDPKDYESSWWVPLSYSTSKQPQFNKTQPQDWLSKGTTSAELNIGVGAGEWFILNNKAAGLYRVNYDRENWALLADTLNSPQFENLDVLNRAQLVIDAMDLAELGDLDYQLAFKVLGYLRHETKFVAWEAGLFKIQPLQTILCRTANYGIFKKFLQSLMTPIVNSVGKLTEESDTFEGSRLQNLITNWACRLDVGDCAAQAHQLFTQWRSTANPDVDNPIPKDVRRTVYSQAVKTGGDETWQFLWQRYKNANLSTEKTNILVALTATREPWLLNRYLEWSLDISSLVKKQDASTVFSAIAYQSAGYYVARQFFFRNIKRISDYYGSKSSIIGNYFKALANQIVYTNELEELRKFSEAHKELLAPANLVVIQALESAQVHINWMSTHYANISSILTDIVDQQP